MRLTDKHRGATQGELSQMPARRDLRASVLVARAMERSHSVAPEPRGLVCLPGRRPGWQLTPRISPCPNQASHNGPAMRSLSVPLEHRNADGPSATATRDAQRGSSLSAVLEMVSLGPSTRQVRAAEGRVGGLR